jgi:hypothetical protein
VYLADCDLRFALAPENILTRDDVNKGRLRCAVGRRYVGQLVKQWTDCCDVEKWMRCCGECRKDAAGWRANAEWQADFGVVEGERKMRESELS